MRIFKNDSSKYPVGRVAAHPWNSQEIPPGMLRPTTRNSRQRECNHILHSSRCCQASSWNRPIFPLIKPLSITPNTLKKKGFREKYRAGVRRHLERAERIELHLRAQAPSSPICCPSPRGRRARRENLPGWRSRLVLTARCEVGPGSRALERRVPIGRRGLDRC